MPFDVVQLDGSQNGVQLYDASGNVIVVQDGQVLPSPKSGVFILGSDGTNARLVKTASDGTVAVAVASLPLPSGAATETTLAAIKAKTDNIDVALSTRTKPSDTQTVSGTVTANAGTNLNTSALALDATLTGGTQRTKLTDGTSNAAVKAASTAAVATDPALVVAVSPNNTVPVSAASLPLPAGAATAAKQPSLGTAGTPSSDVITVQGAASGTALPVSAASLPLPTGASTSANQTNGTQQSKVTDGTSVAAVKAASTAPVATDPALVVAVSPNTPTLPVSVASMPLPTGAATSANQTGGGQKTQVVDGSGNVQNSGDAAARALFTKNTDGTNTAAVKAASTAAVATDPALVVAVSPNNTVPVSASSLPLPTGAAQDATLTGGTQRSKITDGTTNAAVKAASTAAVAADPALVVAVSPNNTVKVDGSAVTQPVSASSLPLPSGASTAAKQPALGTAGTASVDVLSVQGVASMTPLKTDGSGVTQPVSGSVSVSNFPATQPVSAASLPLPTGAATSANQTTLGSQTSKINDGTNTAAVKAASTAPVATDPALVVAISPNSSINASNPSVGTDGSAIPSSSTLIGASDGTNLQQLLVESATNRNLRVGVFNGATEAAVKAASTAAVAADPALVVAVSPNNTVPVSAVALPLPAGAATVAKQPALGTAGTASADVLSVQGIASMTPLKTDGSGVTQPVSGSVSVTNFPATQPVSATSLPLPTGASTAAKQPALGTAGTPSADVLTVQGAASMTALKTDGSGVTQPVSGTVTANIGTSGSLALDATLTGGTQRTKVTDGTNNAAVKAASTAAAATDPALVVAVSPNNTVKVDGSAVTQPISGTLTANQGTGGASAWKVDGSAVTQPVSAASLPLPTGAATSANQTGGGQKTQVVDGSGNVQNSGDVAARALFEKITDGTSTAAVKAASTAAVATDPALVVAISPNNTLGVSVSNFPATQPVSATALPLPTGASTSAKQPALGTAGTPSADVLTIQGAASMTALKTDGSGVTQPVSGTVTANAGTNLNTSALALDATITGGTQRSKITDGTTNAAVKAASTAAVAADPALVVAVSPNNTVPVSAASLPLPAGAATSANQTGGTQKTQIVDGSGNVQPSGDAVGRAIFEKITDGTNTASVKAASTAAVATDPALVVALSPNNSVAVSNFPATQPVSGTVTANAGTNLNTSALALDATLTGGTQRSKVTDGTNNAAVKAASTAAVAADPALVVAISPNNPLSLSTADTTASGALGALNAAVTVAMAGQQGAGFQLSAGTLIGTLVPEISFDGGTTWVASAFDDPNTNTKSSNLVFASANTVATKTVITGGGTSHARIRVSVYTSGTANGALRASTARDPSVMFANPPGAVAPPTLAAVGGQVTTAAPTYSSATNNALSLTTAGALRVDGSAATQPVSGTVTANIGTSGSLALDATLTGGTQRTKVTDGTNNAAVKAASTAAVAADPALVVAISPNNTVPVSAASLPLPTGAATSALQTSGAQKTQVVDGSGNVQNSGDVAARAMFEKITDGTNTAAVKAASTAAVATDPSLVVGLSPNSPLPTGTNTIGQITGSVAAGASATNKPVLVAGVDDTGFIRAILTDVLGNVGLAALQNSSFSPDPSADDGDPAGLAVDASSNLQIRGQVLSDEGSFRDDFSGTSLTTALTGTSTFVNGGLTVTGVGTNFTTSLTTDRYIKVTSQADSAYTRIESIDSDTQLTLASGYLGASASGVAASTSYWHTTTVSTGALTVASSEVLLAPSTTATGSVGIQHTGDYPPYTLTIKARITQRVTNQIAIMGFQDNPSAPTKQAVVVLDGSVGNTQIKFRTSFSAAAADIQETVINLSLGIDTSQTLTYEIDLSANVAVLSINGTIVATHSDHIPGPYDSMTLNATITNTAVVTATTFAINSVFFANLDQIQTANSFLGEPQRVVVVPQASSSVSGIADGSVATAAATVTAIRETAYAEQATNAQRSVVSASANDTAAGTGARTVRITYYDQTLAGPFTETITMNGVTAVNTVGTNICFIEKVEVLTAGTLNTSAGLISLKTTTAGGGTNIATIAAGDVRTFFASHYVGTGKTCNITQMTGGGKGSISGNMFIRSTNILSAGSVDSQVSDSVRITSTAPSFPRAFPTPIAVTGPCRVTLNILPDAATAQTWFGSFDYYEQ